MEEDHFSPDRFVWSHAVAASLTERETAEDLRRHAELTALREEASEARVRLRELIDFDSLQPATLAFDDLRRKLASLVPHGACLAPEDFAHAVLSDRSMFINSERERLAGRTGKLNLTEIKSVLETTEKARSADGRIYSPAAVDWLSKRLASGQLRALRDAEDWNRAFLQAKDEASLRLLVDSLPPYFGVAISEPTLVKIKMGLEPLAAAGVRHWERWGQSLIRLARYADAETAYREAIVRDPASSRIWRQLGHLLRDHLDRYGDAEMAYREAIRHDPRDTWSWIGLGYVLQIDRERTNDAEAAYRTAAECDPHNAWSWIRLAHLLRDELARYDEAEAAYRKAIAAEPTGVYGWVGLGDFLRDHYQRYAEAEAAYRAAISRDPTSPRPWMSLGGLFQDHLGRYGEAEAAYREAMTRDPAQSWPWNALGVLYCEHLDRPSAAREALENAMRVRPDGEVARHHYLYLLRDLMGEGSAARPLLDELRAITKNKDAPAMHLHDALFAAYEANWGLARKALAKALAIQETRLILSNVSWFRAGAVLLHLNYGGELLTLLEERGDTIRFRPWVEAWRALLLGDRRALQNVAPEIRATAQVFYDGIDARLMKLPEKTGRRPLPKARRSRQRRSPGEGRRRR